MVGEWQAVSSGLLDSRWLRAMYHTPILDRRAYELMWEQGGFLVLAPGHAWLQR